MTRLLAAMLLLAPLAVSSAPWQFVAAESRLGFTAFYDGEPFEGRFETFTVQLDFDPADPAAAGIEVQVDPASVDTDNRDRDEALAEPEWFDFQRADPAVYRARGFEARGEGGYRAVGELTLKGVTREQFIEFEWRPDADGAVLSGYADMVGEADVDRMAFGVGSGEWADPELIGHRVRVHFQVRFRRP